MRQSLQPLTGHSQPFSPRLCASGPTGFLWVRSGGEVLQDDDKRTGLGYLRQYVSEPQPFLEVSGDLALASRALEPSGVIGSC